LWIVTLGSIGKIGATAITGDATISPHSSSSSSCNLATSRIGGLGTLALLIEGLRDVKADDTSLGTAVTEEDTEVVDRWEDLDFRGGDLESTAGEYADVVATLAWFDAGPGVALHPKFGIGTFGAGTSSDIDIDFRELRRRALDGERVLEVDLLLTNPFGHSLGTSGTGVVVLGSGFFPCFDANAWAMGIGAAFASLQPKTELPLPTPPSTTWPLIRSSSIHLDTILRVS